MCEEEMIILFNGTLNSTQVLHKAGGIGVEQETALFFHIQHDFIPKLITLNKDRTRVDRNKEKLGKNCRLLGGVCFTWRLHLFTLGRVAKRRRLMLALRS